jgi:hypothetical protein
MAQGSSTVPPPPTGEPQSDIQAPGNGGGMDRFRGIISRLSGGGTPAIDAALKSHHDQVVADAARHADSAKRYYGMVARARATGKNPTTGQPVSPEELQQWQQQADGAWADYTKIAGKSKAAKPIIEKMGGLLKHLGGSGGGQQSQPQQGQQGSQTVAPPPQGEATKPAATVPPPPTSAGTTGNPLQESATGAAEDEAMQHSTAQGDLDAASTRKVAEEHAAHPQRDYVAEIKARSEAQGKEEDAKHKAKMEEIDEAAKVRAEHALSARRTTGSDEDKLQKSLEGKDYVAAKKLVTKAQDDYDGALDRQKTMHQNLADGLKGNQQAMLSLVANHIGMTLGAQKGARITRAVWEEATASTPWLQRIEAKFNGNGYLSGVVLTPDQMRQMVDLADQKVGIVKDHVDRVQQRYAKELAVKGRGRTVSTPPSTPTETRTYQGHTYTKQPDGSWKLAQ